MTYVKEGLDALGILGGLEIGFSWWVIDWGIVRRGGTIIFGGGGGENIWFLLADGGVERMKAPA